MLVQFPTTQQLKAANSLSDTTLVSALSELVSSPLAPNWNPLIHDVDCMQLRLAQKIESQTEGIKMMAKRLGLAYDTHKQAVTRRVLCLICYVIGTQAKTLTDAANTSPYVASVALDCNYRIAA